MVAYLALWPLQQDKRPRTVEFQRVEWNSGDASQTHSIAGVVATSSDRSRMTRMRYANRIFLLFVTDQGEGRSIYNRSLNTSYLIDDRERRVTVYPCTCTWESSEWPVDSVCGGAAKQYNPDLVPVEWSRVAETPVIRYRALNLARFTEVAFAPSANCDLFEEFKIEFGFRLEKSYSHFKVTKYTPGEPPLRLFTPPSTYEFEEKQ